MPIAQWSESLELGNDVIDSDHKRMFGLLEWLEERLYKENDLDSQEIQLVILELHDHVEGHFRREEAMMSHLVGMAQSDKVAHAADHRRWVVELTEHLPGLLTAKTELEQRANLTKVLRVGRAFWREHFQNFDAKLVKYIKTEN
jgi:hemerythrin-like metal-binding protein